MPQFPKYNYLLLEQRAAVLSVTLNRPKQLNALSIAMIEELLALFDSLQLVTDVSVVILQGAGRAFCSGFDVSTAQEQAFSGQSWIYSQKKFSDFIRKIRAVPQVVIAAVHGPAAGGGMAIALACDLRIGAKSAKFQASFVKLGLSGSEMGSTWFLARLVGLSVASELSLTGRWLTSDRAHRLGVLVELVEKDEEVAKAALTLAEEIIANVSPLGIRLTKESLSACYQNRLEDDLMIADRQQVLALADDSCREFGMKHMAKFLPKPKL